MIQYVKIDDIEQLVHELLVIPNHFVFRGHADANWNLESTLERLLKENWSALSASQFEDNSLLLFQSKFHLYDKENITPSSKLAWLAIMQHYGVPTRLVDFTESPFVALYFAMETYDLAEHKDIAIFSIDYRALMKASASEIASHRSDFRTESVAIQKENDRIFDNVVDPSAYPIAWVAEPTQLNARIDRQAGTFLLSGDKRSRLKDVLCLPLYKGVVMKKYVICSSLCIGILVVLQKMNINSKTIYGDLAGLARSVKMQMQMYSCENS